MNNTRDVTNCKVSVTVEARATDKTGQVIICAYGAKSNLARPSVTLSRSNNAFTLVCGKGGDVIPTNYEEAYCPPVSTDGKEALDTCAGNYATILPAYKPSWWSNKKEKTSYELSIPGDKFPEEEVTFVVGCRRASGEDAAKGTGSSAENPSVCYVDVRIEGTGKVSASHAPLVTGMFLGVSLATAGVVVFTSFVSRL
ncbi:SAG-related sequence [Besnoitia besnoiti]|uniref:SAG-related sequence n=1 Tax=Besnoitia besnoiti TaxID=94643 RepID=A0A2A9MM41_BESBE|nr:SAG-related sequence [Besnoitia besnoiti]PFH36833.1 SAG-related sequence [Besnoitia besnoiti]